MCEIGRRPISGRILIAGSIFDISSALVSKTGTLFAKKFWSGLEVRFLREREVSAEVIFGSLTNGKSDMHKV